MERKRERKGRRGRRGKRMRMYTRCLARHAFSHVRTRRLELARILLVRKATAETVFHVRS
jgi:hypothetical protein